ncbi:branched-chain amino acid transporter AzlD, partial [Methylobacterium radiotolerans]
LAALICLALKAVGYLVPPKVLERPGRPHLGPPHVFNWLETPRAAEVGDGEAGA